MACLVALAVWDLYPRSPDDFRWPEMDGETAFLLAANDHNDALALLCSAAAPARFAVKWRMPRRDLVRDGERARAMIGYRIQETGKWIEIALPSVTIRKQPRFEVMEGDPLSPKVLGKLKEAFSSSSLEDFSFFSSEMRVSLWNVLPKGSGSPPIWSSCGQPTPA